MSISPPPLKQPLIDRFGTLSRVWSHWFIDLEKEFVNYSHPLFYAYDVVGDIDISSAWTDITLDTEIKDDTPFDHSADSAVIEISVSGDHEITYYAGAYISANSNRCVAEFKLKIDTGSGYTDVPGSIGRLAMDRYSTGYGSGHCSVSIIKVLSKGDKLKIVGNRLSGSATVKTLANTCGFMIRRWSK